MASGYPIYFHFDISQKILNDLYSTSDIYWHSTGYQIDEEWLPEAHEHFGISVCEAITSNCIPLVVEAAGPREILEDDTRFTYTTIDELVKKSIDIIMNPKKRSELINSLPNLEKYSSYEFLKKSKQIISDASISNRIRYF